jgi:ribonuclease Z
MRAFAEVLGAGNADAAGGLLLFFDDARYLFECGDGTQRYCTEHSVRLARLRGIYLTTLTAPSVGGLLGMVLTIADAGKDRVTIAGPQGLSNLFDSAQRTGFCYRPAMQTDIVNINAPKVDTECSAECDSKLPSRPTSTVVCEDSNLVIRAVPVLASRSKGGNRSVSEDAEFTEEPLHSVLSYVCRMRNIPGKFDPARATELGVRKGPAFGRLTKGESITLPDGVVVKPEDVMSPSTPGPVILIVACPSVRHIGCVVSNLELCPVHLGVLTGQRPSTAAPVCVLYHLVPRKVLAHADYQAWCAKFGSHTTHITLHSSMAPERVVFASQAQDLDHLHCYDSERFFPPWQSMVDISTNGQPVDMVAADHPNSPAMFLTNSICEGEQTWLTGDCGMQFILAPTSRIGVHVDEIPPRFVGSMKRKPLGQNATEILSKSVSPESEMSDPLCVASFNRTTAEVCFLGTAAAIPGKHRNVSGIMLRMFARGGLLMDCGEGTWGQLTRAYGMDAARDILCSLKIVFISHIHADHHLGLLTLLYERKELLSRLQSEEHWPQLVVIGPRQLREWLHSFETTVYGSNSVPLYKFCDADDLTDPQRHESKFFVDSYGLEIACVHVVHCPNSYGIVVVDKLTGWKLVYSGDTRPCRALAEAGSGATLAIHEATLDDSMEAEAVDKNHSTTSEAIRVCADWMGAWRTVLTHFSQRYPRIPLLDSATMRNLEVGRAAVAFDLMRINFADLRTLPLAMPAVKAAFPNDATIPEDVCEAQVTSLGGCV